MPPPGVAILPAVGQPAIVTSGVTASPLYVQPTPVAAPVGIPPVVTIPQTTVAQVAPSVVGTSYQIPGITSVAASVAAPPVEKTTASTLEVKPTREELVKRLAEENENLSLSSQENMSIRGQSARHEVMQRLMRTESSPVIVLKNMVEPEDVDDTLQEEIMEECSKFGTVERVLIYQESQSDEDIPTVVVKIFVEFSNSNSKFILKVVVHMLERLFHYEHITATSYFDTKL